MGVGLSFKDAESKVRLDFEAVYEDIVFLSGLFLFNGIFVLAFLLSFVSKSPAGGSLGEMDSWFLFFC